MSEELHPADQSVLTLLYVPPAGSDDDDGEDEDEDDEAVVETLRSVLDRRLETAVGSPGQEPDADCLLVDAASDVEPDRLATHPGQVALHTETFHQVSSPLFEVADTVVEKRVDESKRRFYCERLQRLLTGTEPDDRPLATAFDRTDGPLGGEAAYYLVAPDGTVEWASAPLETVVPGLDTRTDSAVEGAGMDGDPGTSPGRNVAGFDERLEAVFERIPGTQQYVRQEPAGVARYLTLPVDGETRHFRLETHNPDGVAEGYRLEVVREVTGAVDVANRLDTARSLVEEAQDGLYTLDETGTIDFCNESFAAMLGYEPAELVGEHASTVSVPGEFERAREVVGRLRENPGLGSLTVDAVCQHRDGHLVDVSFHFSVIRGRNGVFDGLAGVARDVTERKTRERELERYETLVNAATDPMFAVGPDGRLTLANDAFLEAVSLDRETAVGASPSVLVEEGVVATETIDTWQRAYSELADCGDRQVAYEFEVDATFEGSRTFEGRLVRFDDDGSTLNIFRDVTDRKAREEELARLETVVASVQPLTETLTGATTRAQLESELCERLADSAAYTGAWVGTAHASRGRQQSRAAAGLPEDWVVSAPDGEDPVSRAVRTGEPQVVDQAGGVSGDADGGGDGNAATETDADVDQPRSVVVVPLTYRSTTHGVLAVQHADPEAVTDRELSVLFGLGQRVGQAVTAIENRRLLRGDRAVELRFDETPATTPFARVATTHDCTLELKNIARVGEEASLFHVAVEGTDGETVAEALADTDGIEFVRALGTGGDADRVQCRHAGRCPFAALIDHGGTVRRAHFSPAGTTVVADFAPGADTAAAADAVTTACSAFEVVSQRDRERDGAAEDPSLRADEPRVWDQLTDRQREVVSAAYHAGYYDWPRGTTAEDLADALGISAPTLHQHVRKAHARLVGSLLDGMVVFDARP